MPVKTSEHAQDELLPHDPFWIDIAEDEINLLRLALGASLDEAHHIGTTAIPTIKSKPVIDLLAVIQFKEQLADVRLSLEAMDYVCCKNEDQAEELTFYKNEPSSEKRLFALEVFLKGNPQIEKQITLKQQLLKDPLLARVYQEKNATN